METTNIVICCDGTWDDPNEETNVYRLFKLLKEEPFEESEDEKIAREIRIDLEKRRALKKRIIVYFRKNENYKYVKGVSGMFNSFVAADLPDIIKYVYQVIVKRYNNEANKSKLKEIWLFGFSRGAYTARCVAGIIQFCGILKYNNKELIDRAYELYRNKSSSNDPEGQEYKKFRETYSHSYDPATKNDPNLKPYLPIKFLGLWDTVGDYGVPAFEMGEGFEFLNFFDLNVYDTVRHAYQILSIHENFALYKPCHIFKKDSRTKLEEIWFPGNHATIGGGKSSKDQIISYGSYSWMIRKVKDTGGLPLGETSLCEYLKETLKSQKSWFEKALSWIYERFKKSILRDRIITPYKSYNDNNEDTKSHKELTFDLLYNAGRWYSESIFKNIENMDYEAQDSLTKFYKLMEGVLIDELKGVCIGEIAYIKENRKKEYDIIEKNIKQIRDLYNKGKEMAGEMEGASEENNDIIKKIYKEEEETVEGFLISKELHRDKIKKKAQEMFGPCEIACMYIEYIENEIKIRVEDSDVEIAKKIYELFSDKEIGENRINNIYSFSASTISKFNIRRIINGVNK